MKKTFKNIFLSFIGCFLVTSCSTGRVTKDLPGGDSDTDDHVYEISWLHEDGTLLDTTYVNEGEKPSYTGDTSKLVRNEDYKYSYNFVGWSPEIEEATCDKAYTAIFNPVAKDDFFKVNFYDDSGEGLIYSATFEKGSRIVYEGEDHNKDESEFKFYNFKGWDVENIDGTEIRFYDKDEDVFAAIDDLENYQEVNFIEVYDEIEKGVITWKKSADTHLTGDDLIYGTSHAKPGEDPTLNCPIKATDRDVISNDGQNKFVFKEWEETSRDIDGGGVYTAIYNIWNKVNINWYAYDNTFDYGDGVNISNPNYKIIGTSSVFRFENEIDGNLTDNAPSVEGSLKKENQHESLVFNSWMFDPNGGELANKNPDYVTANLDKLSNNEINFYAKYDVEDATYDVVFHSDDGSILYTFPKEEAKYGADVCYPGDFPEPTKFYNLLNPDDINDRLRYDRQFCNWGIKDEDGNLVTKTVESHEGTSIDMRLNDAFKIEGDIHLYPMFTCNIREYKVKWYAYDNESPLKDSDNSAITSTAYWDVSNNSWKIGEIPDPEVIKAQKQTTNTPHMKYTFNHTWSTTSHNQFVESTGISEEELTVNPNSIDQEFSFYACYDAGELTYNVKFLNYNGDPLNGDGVVVHEGQIISLIPQVLNDNRPENVRYTYEFQGWLEEENKPTDNPNWEDPDPEKFIEKQTYEDNLPSNILSTEEIKSKAINDDSTFYAVYKPVPKYYNIRFLDDNGDYILPIGYTENSLKVKYGEKISANFGSSKVGSATKHFQFSDDILHTITRADNNEYRFSKKWKCVDPTSHEPLGDPDDPALQTGTNEEQTVFVVTEERNVFQAQYETGETKYTVRFVNYDGTSIRTDLEQYTEGQKVTSTPNASRTENAKYWYQFMGWGVASGPYKKPTNLGTGQNGLYNDETSYNSSLRIEVSNYPITCDTTFYALYEPKKQRYEIKFEVDGVVKETSNYDYGQTPTAPSSYGHKQEQYDYFRFSGFGTMEIVTGPKTYSATYSKYPKQYITFICHTKTSLLNIKDHLMSEWDKVKAKGVSGMGTYTYYYEQTDRGTGFISQGNINTIIGEMLWWNSDIPGRIGFFNEKYASTWYHRYLMLGDITHLSSYNNNTWTASWKELHYEIKNKMLNIKEDYWRKYTFSYYMESKNTKTKGKKSSW